MKVRPWNADENGMTPDDWREMRWGIDQWHDRQRWQAFKALWCRPVARRQRRDGVVEYERNRDEEWTLWRSICATVGLIFDRRPLLTEDRSHYVGWPNDCVVLAYWDAWPTYGGYNVELIQLYPGCRVELFNDGEFVI